MRVSIKHTIFTLLLIMPSAFLYPETVKCEKITSEMIGKHIPVSDFSVISIREVHGVCEVIINVSNRIIPLYGNADFLVSGDLYHNRINITKDKLYEINKNAFIENRNTLDEIAAFEYKPAEIKSKKVLYMFTEPFVLLP
jgi:thiol:disulfide interchange protein DsbC